MDKIYANALICQGGKIIEGSLAVKDGFIDEIIPAGGVLPEGEVKDVKGNYLMPVFIDTHIHGFGGYGTDCLDGSELLKMSELLAKNGVGAFAPTIYPNEPKAMIKNIEAMAEYIGREKGAKIMGLHIEGPFISPKKLGVMKPEAAAKPDLNLMKAVYEAAGGKICAMTLAPELDGIEKIIDFCLERGIIPQVGHTDASYNEVLASGKLNHATHLFNAMRGIGHRDPGAAGAALLEGGFSFEIIADGVHVCPEIVKMALSLKDKSKVILVTDALRPAGTQGGLANNEEVSLRGGVFRRVSDGVVAGSALTMLKGAENLSKWGMGFGGAAMAAAENPARLHKLDFGMLQSGKRAYFNIIDKDFNLLETVM